MIDHTFSAIITAGGSGIRFDSQQKKQFLSIAGKPILFYAIDIFYQFDCIREIIITLPVDNLTEQSEVILQNYPYRVKCIAGGKTRQQSVFNALCQCEKTIKHVIIHDGVRPFLAKNDLLSMLELMNTHHALIAGSKVKNTLKKVNKDTIIETLTRDDIIEVYTPQVFDLSTIFDLHQKANNLGITFTDDASICEYFHQPVFWYDTTSPALKITTKDDLQYAEWLLNNT